jgi:hypothetical protein
MVVVAHEAVAVADPVVVSNDPPEDGQKFPWIGIREKDVLPGIFSRRHMVEGMGVLDAQRPGHARRLACVDEKTRPDPSGSINIHFRPFLPYAPNPNIREQEVYASPHDVVEGAGGFNAGLMGHILVIAKKLEN